jgi:hypothetical protein
MESTLKAQLNKLKLIQEAAPNLEKNSSATMLFDFQKGRKIDIDTIYELGYSGIIELCRINRNFIKYIPLLFQQTSKYFNRNTRSEEELKKVDLVLTELIINLIPYFKIQSCHKILEFLIKIYKSNVYQGKELVLAFLPYHEDESKFYLKLSQNVNYEQFQQSFQFFSLYAKLGKSILFEALVKELSSNTEVFQEILEFYHNCQTIYLENQQFNHQYFIFCTNLFLSLFSFYKANDKGKNNFTLILTKFLNSGFQHFKKFLSMENNMEYQFNNSKALQAGLCLNKFCELLIKSNMNLKFTSDFLQAILNDLINKVFLFISEDYSKFFEKMTKTLLILSTAYIEQNNNDSYNCLSPQTLSNFSSFFNVINNSSKVFQTISENYSMVNLLFIMIDSYSSSVEKDLDVEKFIFSFLKTIFLNETSVQQILSRSFRNPKLEIYVSIIKFLSNLYPNFLNSSLIKVFSSQSQEDKNLSINVKSILIERIDNYSHFFISQASEINGFNLFLNINSDNVATILEGIDIFEKLFQNDDKNKDIINYTLPSLINKFIFMDNELILNRILKIKNLSTLLQQNSTFRDELLNFYFKIHEKNIKLYSKEFLTILEEIIIQNIVSIDSDKTLKILLFSTFLYREIKHSENFWKSFSKNNSKLFSKNPHPIKDDRISLFELIPFLSSYSSKIINSKTFLLEIYQFLSTETILLQLGEKSFNEIFELIFQLYLKERDKMDFLKTLIIEEFQIIVKLLFIPKLPSSLFERISEFLIINIPLNFKELNISDCILLLEQLSFLLISNNKFTLFDLLLKTHFKGNISQIFISRLIIKNLDTLEGNGFISEIIPYLIENKFNAQIEFCLQNALLCSLIHPKKLSKLNLKLIIDFLSSVKNLNFSSFHYLLINKTSSNQREENTEKDKFHNLLFLNEELKNHENEILINNKLISEIIQNRISLEYYKALIKVFLSDFDIISAINLDEIQILIQVFSHLKIVQKTKSQNIDKKEMSEIFSSLNNILQILQKQENLRKELFVLIEIIFTTLLEICPSSSIDILNIVIQLPQEGEFISNEFFLLLSQNFNFSDNLSFDLFFKILCLFNKKGISPENFNLLNIQNKEKFSLRMLKNFTSQIKMEEGIFYNNFFYTLEVIQRILSYYYNSADFIFMILKIIKNIQSSFHQFSTYFYSNISYYLFSIISNSTIENSMGKEFLQSLEDVNEIIRKIFGFIINEDYLKSDNEYIEMLNIINTFINCYNKMLSYVKNSESKEELIRKLIEGSFETLIINEGKIHQDILRRAYLILLNALQNFIELLFEESLESTSIQNINLNLPFLTKFLNLLSRLSIKYIKNFNLIQEFILKLMKIKIISDSPYLISCIFMNLTYYNSIWGKSLQEDYNQIIFNYFSNLFVNDKKNESELMITFEIICEILKEIRNKNPFNIEIEGNKKEKINHSLQFLSIDLLNRISSFMKFKEFKRINSERIICNILSISDLITDIKKEYHFELRKKIEHDRNLIPNALNQLKEFDENLNLIFNQCHLIHLITESLFSSEYEKYINKNVRNYFLQKYLDYLMYFPWNEGEDEKNSQNKVFDSLISNYNKESNYDNIQLMFTILTNLLKDGNNKNHFYKILQNSNLESIIDLLQFKETNIEKDKSLNYSYSQFSIFIFLSKIFTLFENEKFLDKFNLFLNKLTQGLDLLNKLKNEELSLLILETILFLSVKRAGFFSPILNDFILKLLNLSNLFSKGEGVNYSDKINNKILQIFTNISKKQDFQISYNSVKNCIKTLDLSTLKSNTLSLLFNYFNFSIQSADKLILSENIINIFKFFLRLLLNSTLKHSINEEILKCFQSFIFKINEKQLKKIFEELMKFGKEMSSDNPNFKYNVNNCIVTFELFNSILSGIRDIFVPYFEKYKSFYFELLSYMNSIFSNEDRRNKGKKKERQFFDSYLNEEVEGVPERVNNKFSYIYLNTLLLENLRLIFVHSKSSELILADTIEECFEPLIGQLKFIFYGEEKSINYFEQNISSCFIDIFKNITDENLFKNLNDMVSYIN